MSVATGETAGRFERAAAPSRLRSLVRGNAANPAWQRPALLGLLAGTALLYLVALGASGWANGFYAAAVQAATKSWKAFFFGSFDASNFITVDKPPASLWVMDLSARLFGLSSWSLLIPQALEGVAAVGILYATVRRRFGPAAGLLAGAALALTPVATLMFRFDNPDALLTLVLVASAYALTRALERASTRWLLLAGTLIGLGFLTKMLQAFLVVPGFAAVYLLAAPTGLRRRIGQLLAAGAALVVSAGWWIAIVTAWPASSRPYIGGSQHNSVLELVFGYNGFGRITGNESGSVVGGGFAGRGGGPGPGAWGPTGLTRLFGSEMGTQISWLLPAALLFLVALLWARGRAPRTDGRRAAVLLWGSWLVVTGLVFSLAQGIIHPYYNVALAPAIAALVGIGAVWVWRERASVAARLAGAAAVALTAWWGYTLLDRTPAWLPWLRLLVLVGGISVAAALLVPHTLLGALSPPAAAGLAAAAIGVSLAAPAAYAIQTAATPHAGAIPSAGPSGASVRSGFGGRPQQRAFGGPPRGFGAGGFGAPPAAAQGRFGGFGGGFPGGGGRAFGRPPGASGALGGLLQAGTPSAALARMLQSNSSSVTWAAAAVGANSAAGLQLASGEPIMAIGGFNGTDPTPTLAQFQRLVVAGKIHYFLGGGRGGFGGPGASRSSSAIASWVEGHFTARTVDGATVYDLTAGN